LGCQFHPEFKSKPLEPHPIFREFITASYKNRQNKTEAVHVTQQAVEASAKRTVSIG
jgi:CTP synthase